MRYINKEAREPVEFLNVIGNALNYNNLSREQKNRIKQFLLAEQHEMCCYCGQIIGLNVTTTEHLIGQSDNEMYRLAYHNLLASCNGSSKVNKAYSHCNRHRGLVMFNLYTLPFMLINKSITLRQANGNITLNKYFDVEMSRLGEPNGRIIPRIYVPARPRLFNQVQSAIDILNLNSEILVQARVDAFNETLNVYYDTPYDQIFDALSQLNTVPFKEFQLLCLARLI